MSEADEPQPIVSLFVNEAESWGIDPQLIPFMMTVPFTANNTGRHPITKPYYPPELPALSPSPMPADRKTVRIRLRVLLTTIWMTLILRRKSVAPAEEPNAGRPEPDETG